MYFKMLLEFIPAEHRPVLDTTIRNQVKEMITGGPRKYIGTTLIPVILTGAQVGASIRIALYAIVVPKLFIAMFVGRTTKFLDSEEWSEGGLMYV
jgi:hypothetical protein